jgi:tRNA threonylcarbamoyladenosine modification (KEOPS) complex Cgi121 subunit
MTETFYISKKSYHIENIYCSIDINNIENYLKRIEKLEKRHKNKINIIIVPKTLIYSEKQINWAIFIAKNRFLDKINISKKLFTEVLSILSVTNQIKNINQEWFLKEGNNYYYINLLSKEKLNKIEIREIIKEANVKEKRREKKNIKKIIDYYKIKGKREIENKIIEKMAISLYK